MSRPFFIIATVLSILLGTGGLNVACLCAGSTCSDIEAAPASACHAAPDAGAPSCCCEAPTDDNGAVPDNGDPERCPCLYWTGVPLSTAESSTGLSLVKRAIELAPALLLEAVSSPLVVETAATTRDVPHGARDPSVRLQAWHCVWTI